jgi:hypothetical protein
MSFYWDALIPNFDISLICVHRDFIEFSSNGRNSCTSCFTNNLTIPTCSTNNFFISIHIMTQKVHNMYYDFISIQIMRYISYIYDWISPILLFANYIRHFSTHTCRYIASILMLGFCMNPYATSFTSSPSHGMYSYFIMFSQGKLRGKVLLTYMSEDHSL